MSELKEIFERSVDQFGRYVHAVGDDQWSSGTPCADWDVRALVNHLVYEDKWVAPLLEGKTIEEVGDAYEGDLLGADPKKAWEEASQESVRAVDQPDVDDRTVHLSFGDFSGKDYITQVLADHVIHAWDLARGIGADEKLDAELVDFAYKFFEQVAEAYRAAGAFGNKVEVDEGADRQTKLLAMTGRKA